MIRLIMPKKSTKSPSKKKSKTAEATATQRSTKQTKQRRKHFRELSIEKMNGATYSWRIRDEELIDRILNAKNTQKFTSDKFKIGELEFCLELYPNGFDANSQGLVDLFLKLTNIPSEWSEVWVNYKLFNPDTMSSWTFIRKFKKGGFWGWHDGCLMFDELKQQIIRRKLAASQSVSSSSSREEEEEEVRHHDDAANTDDGGGDGDGDGDTDEDAATFKQYSAAGLLSPCSTNGHDVDYRKLREPFVTFSCFLQILKVSKNTTASASTSHSHNHSNKQRPARVVYEKSLLFGSEYHFKLEWNITSAMLALFKTGKTGKYYESDIFYEMWNLRVSPNGALQQDNQGHVTLFLNLCCLPPKISRIRVRFILHEEQSNATWKCCREFSYNAARNASFCGWPNHTLLTADLQHYKTLKFTADVYIVNMYDDKGKQIDIPDNLTEIKEDEQIGTRMSASSEPSHAVAAETRNSNRSQPQQQQQQPNTTRNSGPNAAYGHAHQPQQTHQQPREQANNMANASSASTLGHHHLLNGTQISPSHTHNITINTSDKEYKALHDRIDSIEHKLDAVTNIVLSVQQQISALALDVKSALHGQYRPPPPNTRMHPEHGAGGGGSVDHSLMSVLHEIRSELQAMKTRPPSISFSQDQPPQTRPPDHGPQQQQHKEQQKPVYRPVMPTILPAKQSGDLHSSSVSVTTSNMSSIPSIPTVPTIPKVVINEIPPYRMHSRRTQYHSSHHRQGQRTRRGLLYSKSPHRQYLTLKPSTSKSQSPSTPPSRSPSTDCVNKAVTAATSNSSTLPPPITHMHIHTTATTTATTFKQRTASKSNSKSKSKSKSKTKSNSKPSNNRRTIAANATLVIQRDMTGSDDEIKIIKPRLPQKEIFRVWLKEHVKLEQYFDDFVEYGVTDIGLVMDMTIQELKMIGIQTKQHQLQIQKEITKLRNARASSQRNSANLFDTV